jgi:hypothetical protein
MKNNLTIALRNVQRTLTKSQAFAIARAAIQAELAPKPPRNILRGPEAFHIAVDILGRALAATSEDEAIRLGTVITEALELVPNEGRGIDGAHASRNS